MVSATDVAGVLAGLVDARRAESSAYRCAKRAFDVFFATAVLLVALPVILVAALAVRLDSPGPAFFLQPRMGRGGSAFRLVKLRGMYVDAPVRFAQLFDYGSVRPDQGDAFFFHTDGDPRVTRVGRLIRKYSIDELPNFINVLLGHMSVVGPRPEIPELAPLYGEHLGQFLSVRPGVTSPSKAAGRDALSFSENLASDLWYVEHRSMRTDMMTVLRTARSVLRGKNVCG